MAVKVKAGKNNKVIIVVPLKEQKIVVQRDIYPNNSGMNELSKMVDKWRK